MIKNLLFSLLFLSSIYVNSQINFEEGYFIDNSGKKTTCFIKNIDWKNNPTEFEYKLTTEGDLKNESIRTVKEFSIIDYSKYIRATVDIDKSSEQIEKLSINRNPIFKKEQLFLKVLVEGTASLFKYEEGNLTRYFYNVQNSEIKQLVFKSYKTSNNKIATNNYFRQQLLNSLKCSTISEKELGKLSYEKKSLTNFFVKYNSCNNSESINFEEKNKKDLFNLNVRPRFNSSSFKMENAISNIRNADFGSEQSFGLGLEAELILPFNKNKWALSVEPTYQSFKGGKTITTSNVVNGTVNSVIEYKSIELPFTLRHYFYLNDDSKIFVNASYIIDFSLDSFIGLMRVDDSSIFGQLETESRPNVALGLGYKFKDKYSLEIRYLTGREILGGYTYYRSDYKTLSVIIGYTLF